MRQQIAAFAVRKFKEVKESVGKSLEEMAGSRLECIIHQVGPDFEWRCEDIEIDHESGAVYGTFFSSSDEDGSKNRQKNVVLDVESVRAIEFEIFEGDVPSSGQAVLLDQIVAQSPRGSVVEEPEDDLDFLLCPECKEPGRDTGVVMECANEECPNFGKFYAAHED